MKTTRRIHTRLATRWHFFILFAGIFVGCFSLTIGLQAAHAADFRESELPPHIVIYLKSYGDMPSPIGFAVPQNPDRKTGARQIADNGMTFNRVMAASSDLRFGFDAFRSGSFPIGADDGRTLADYLKLKGYRLLLIGDQPSDVSDRFQFEKVPGALESLDGKSFGDGLGQYLSAEVERDQRPICLVIFDSEEAKLQEIELGDSSAGGSAGSLPDSSAGDDLDKLGQVFHAVQTSLARSNTMFVYSSICGQRAKETTPQWQGHRLRVPLMVVWDGHVPAGRTSDSLVSAVDILPTLVELAGATPPSEIDGRSFAGVLRGESHEHRDVAYSVIRSEGSLDRYCVCDSRFKYISGNGEDSKTLLYDLLSDPNEQRNVSDDPAFADRLNELNEQLSIWLQKNSREKTNES